MAIYNNGGNTHISNSDVTTNMRNANTNTYATYGIYSPTGVNTIESGSIYSAGKATAYGIYTNTGTITTENLAY
jgi:FlaG/FlaF family flagellin (archaellin)